MTFEDISFSRLVNQKVKGSKISDPNNLVEYMGAMQAQDFPMALWAVGMRLGNLDLSIVEEAFNQGDILRTHVLRPTWHLVAREDIRWMLALTAPRIKASIRSRWKELELDESTFIRCQAVIERLLAGGKQLTRDEMLGEITKTIPVFDQRGAHLLLRAELDGLICSGAIRNAKQTYALLEERVPAHQQQQLSEDEALGRLAERYFTSHGPATLQDFAWWSGLSATSAKKGIEIADAALSKVSIAGKVYWLGAGFAFETELSTSPEVFLVAAYDEFLISYQDRSPSINLTEQKHAFSNNGIFRPVIVVSGQTTGIWKRTIKKDLVIIEPTFFAPVNKEIKAAVVDAAEGYARFLNLKAEVVW